MKTAFETAGDVRAVDLLAAFVTAWREATSGSLRFSRGAVEAGFDLADGEIIAVSSSEPRFETAAILVRAGKLGGPALERLSVAPGADGALAALQAGILTRREWKWGEKIRAVEVLADLLAWPDGTCAFDREARPARGEFVLALPRLLLELFLRSRDRNLIEHQLGPTDVALVRSEAFEEEFATFGLTADAESVVRLIDGRATASEISARAPAEEFAVLKLLAALKTLGLLRTGETPDQPEPAALAPEEEVLASSEPIFEPWEAPEAPELPVTGPEPERTLGETPLGEAADVSLGRREESRDWALPESPPEAAPLGEEASPWEQRPVGGEWEQDEDLRDRPAPEKAEPVLEPERSGRLWGLLLAGLFLLLVAAVAATVILRSRRPSREQVAAVQPAATAVPAALAPTVAPAPPTAPPAPTSAPTRPAARSLAPTSVPRARPAPTRASAAASAPPAGATQAEWLERARRDRRRLESERKTRYAVQLELACEAASLAEAWKHDQPAGSMWLLTATHGGRPCFRVLWGRYRSLEEARRAKAGTPSYFTTSTNRPAIVSVR